MSSLCGIVFYTRNIILLGLTTKKRCAPEDLQISGTSCGGAMFNPNGGLHGVFRIAGSMLKGYLQ